MTVTVECGCGKVFEAKRMSRYKRCPTCAERAKVLAQARWRERQQAEKAPLQAAVARHVTNLTVVRDPLDENGGFRAGVTFSKDDWQLMMRFMTFTPGTILRDAQQRLYEFRLGEENL